MIHRGRARVMGRYLMCVPIAAGGMATVHLGRLLGPKGFSRTVAIKQLHAQFARDTDFVAMFLDEARLTGRIRHPNVVAPLDIVESDGDLCIVMEYVHGEALGRLMQAARPHPVPHRVITAIMIQALLGLHAAHEATDDNGQPLSIVHRDVSPQNILVGEDGITRVVDFGIAKAARRVHSTDGGKLKGKLGYMSPEQLRLLGVDRRSDIFSAGIVLWELLTDQDLFTAEEPAAAIAQMLKFEPTHPSSVKEGIPASLDAIAMRALAVDRNDRFETAREMARALEEACPPAGALEVSEWVLSLVGEQLSQRADWVADVESMSLAELTQSHPVPNASGDTVIVPPADPTADVGGVDGLKLQRSTVALEDVSPLNAPREASQTRSLVVTSTRYPPVGNVERRTLTRSIWFATAVGVVVAMAGFGIHSVRTAHTNLVRSTALATPLTSAPAVPPPDAAPLTSASLVTLPASDGPPPSGVPIAAAPSAGVSTGASAPRDMPADDDSGRRTAATSKASIRPPRDSDPKPKTTAQPGVDQHASTVSEHEGPPTVASRSNRTNQTAKARLDCAVPYVIDEKGIKRFREECFAKPK